MVSDKFIGTKIRELRKNADLDVDSFGAAIGRSGKAVSAWETGRNVPSADMLITICRHFGVGISYFYPSDVAEPAQARQMELSDREQHLVDLYRKMDAQYRAMLLKSAEAYVGASVREADVPCGSVSA